MKTTVQGHVDELQAGDIFKYGGESYKVISTEPQGALTRISAVDIDGKPEPFRFPTLATISVIKDDGLAGAPSHVVVDLKDGYVWNRSVNMTRGEGFTLESATAYAKERNEGLDPKDQTYRVFALSPVDQEV